MLSTSHSTFKQDLKTSRLARHLSAVELSRAVGISDGMIARYESSTRKDRVLPNLGTLKKINAVLFPAGTQNSVTVIEASDEEKADRLPLQVLIKAIKKHGAKDVVF